jgi:hypothetical protein
MVGEEVLEIVRILIMLEYCKNMHQSRSKRSSKSKKCINPHKTVPTTQVKKGNFRYLIKLSGAEDIARAAITFTATLSPSLNKYFQLHSTGLHCFHTSLLNEFLIK